MECRLCASASKKNLIDVFDKRFTNGEAVRLYVLLATGVEIKQSDSVTTSLCSSCVRMGMSTYVFRTKAMKTDKMLRERAGENNFSDTISYKAIVCNNKIILRNVKLDKAEEVKRKVEKCNSEPEKIIEEHDKTNNITNMHESVRRLYEKHPDVQVEPELLKLDVDPKIVLRREEVYDYLEWLEKCQIKEQLNKKRKIEEEEFNRKLKLEAEEQNRKRKLYEEEQNRKRKLDEEKQNRKRKLEEDEQNRERKLDEEKQNRKSKLEEEEQNRKRKLDEEEQNRKRKLEEAEHNRKRKHEEEEQNEKREHEEEERNRKRKLEEEEQNKKRKFEEVEKQVKTCKHKEEEAAIFEKKRQFCEQLLLKVDNNNHKCNDISSRSSPSNVSEGYDSFLSNDDLLMPSDGYEACNESEPENELIIQKSQNIYVCNMCNDLFETKKSLLKHRKVHNGCPYCKQRFELRTNLNIHIQKKCKYIHRKRAELILKRCDEDPEIVERYLNGKEEPILQIPTIVLDDDEALQTIELDDDDITDTDLAFFKDVFAKHMRVGVSDITVKPSTILFKNMYGDLSTKKVPVDYKCSETIDADLKPNIPKSKRRNFDYSKVVLKDICTSLQKLPPLYYFSKKETDTTQQDEREEQYCQTVNNSHSLVIEMDGLPSVNS